MENINYYLVEQFNKYADNNTKIDVIELDARQVVQCEKYGVSAPIHLWGDDFSQGDASDEEMIEYAKSMNIPIEENEDDEYDFSEVIKQLDRDLVAETYFAIIRKFGQEEKAFEFIEARRTEYNDSI